MQNGTMLYTPQTGVNVMQGSPGMPGPVTQQAGMAQCVGQQPGSNGLQQSRRVGPLEKFLKTEAKTLGAIQIIIGLIHIGFGGVSIVFIELPLPTLGGYPFWGGLFFIASGSVSISAEKRMNSSLVECSIGMNTASAVMASIGIILFIAELSIQQALYSRFPPNYIKPIGQGFAVLLLLFALLQFCITVSAVHFGCQAACCNNDMPMAFVTYTMIGDGTTPAENNPHPSDCDHVFLLPSAEA